MPRPVSDKVETRPERAGDEPAIRAVLEAAFETPAEADLVDALRAGGHLVPELCLVAEAGGEVVGYIAFSRARLEEGGVAAGAAAGAGAASGAGGPELLALAPMAVHPGRQNAGIGYDLVYDALQRAEETSYPLVVVLGHPDYYPRFGFDPASAYGIACPYPGVPPEAWMAYTLPAYTPGISGTVRYADPFTVATP
jgi:predicted N-acetyltransferase YhbS